MRLGLLTNRTNGGEQNIDLCQIENSQALASLEHRRVVFLNRFFDKFIQLTCRDAPILLLMHFFDGFKELIEISTAFARNKKNRAVVEERGIDLQNFCGNAPSETL